MPETLPPPGWYHDPTAPGDGRYWDGTTWTHSVSRDGVTIQVPIDPSVAVVPPVPGSEMRVPIPPTQAPTVSVTTSERSPVGAIIGMIVVVLLIVLVFVVINNNDSSNDTPKPTNAPPAEAPPAEAPPADAPPATEGG